MSNQKSVCRSCFVRFESETNSLLCSSCTREEELTISEVYVSMPRRVSRQCNTFRVVKGRSEDAIKPVFIFDMNTGKACFKDEDGLEIED